MIPAMDTLATPANIASLIARNLVPAVGVLFLGWSAGNLLVLYYLDTILSAAVVMLLIARHITGLGKAGQRGRPLEGPLDWIKASLGSLLGATLICLPLGVPLVWTLAQFDWSVAACARRHGHSSPGSDCRSRARSPAAFRCTATFSRAATTSAC